MKQNKPLNNLPCLRDIRKDLRNNLTSAEAYLWMFLKNSQLEGRKFRRQHSIGSYVLDFYCPSEKLAVELDGQGHFTSFGQTHDSERTLYLNSLGINVLRFENNHVFRDVDGVLEIIKSGFGRCRLQPPLM